MAVDGLDRGANGGSEFACSDILRVRGGSLTQQMLVNYLLNHKRVIYRNRERKMYQLFHGLYCNYLSSNKE